MNLLKINFLGAPSITYGEMPLVDLQGAWVTLRCFAFLVVQRTQPQSRDKLAELFWPDLPATRARAALSTTLWRLRQMLGEANAILLTDKTTVQFDLQATYWLDIDEFDRLTQALAFQATPAQAEIPLTEERLMHFEQALALYRGDFLEGVSDDWCVPQRTQWRERYFNTLTRFVEECQVQGELARALVAARQLVALDPYRQTVHQRLIELYIALNRVAEAQTQFAQYEQLWRDDLQLPLSTEMLQLAAQHHLRTSSTSSISPVAKFTAAPSSLSTSPSILQHDKPEYLRRELEIRRQHDELYDLQADRQLQQENLTVAQALADKLHDPASQIEIMARRAWLATRQGRYTDALTLLQDALRLCAEAEKPALRPMLHRLMGVTCEEKGNFKGALHHYRQALALDEAQQSSTFTSANLNNVAAVQITFAHYLLAIQGLERAQTLLTASSSTTFQIKVSGNLGIAWLRLGQVEKASHYLQQAMTLAQRTGEHDAEWWLAVKLALLYHCCGDTTHAISLVLHHYNAASSAGDAWVLAALSDVLAECYIDRGDTKQGLSWAKQIAAHAAQKELWRYQVRGLLRLGQAQMSMEQTKAAFCSVEQAVAHYTSQNQALEEEPELFWTYARYAQVNNHAAIVAQFQQKFNTALRGQLGAIPDPTLRQSFLKIQRFPCPIDILPV